MRQPKPQDARSGQRLQSGPPPPIDRIWVRSDGTFHYQRRKWKFGYGEANSMHQETGKLERQPARELVKTPPQSQRRRGSLRLYIFSHLELPTARESPYASKAS